MSYTDPADWDQICDLCGVFGCTGGRIHCHKHPEYVRHDHPHLRHIREGISDYPHCLMCKP